MFRNILWMFFITLSTAWGAPAGSAQPVFIPLDDNTQATGISGDGSIVVGAYLPNGSGGFYWTADTGVVRIGGNAAAGISADGSTIVGRANDEMRNENAAYWQWDGSWTLLGSFTPDSAACGQFLSSGYGVNGDGTVIVGLGWDGCSYAHGFRWDAECGMADLGSIVLTRASRANAISADGQMIVGWSDQATGFRQGARWMDGSWQWLFDGPDNPVGEALAVNFDGSIIVGYGCGSATQYAWRWTEETGVECVQGTLADPYQTLMLALSDDGQVIGGAVAPDFGPNRNALLWLNGEPVDLLDYLLQQGVAEVKGWSLNSVTAVSSDGHTIAGWGVSPDLRVHAFIATLP